MLMHQMQNPYFNTPFQQSFAPGQGSWSGFRTGQPGHNFSSGWSNAGNMASGWYGGQQQVTNFNPVSTAYSYRLQPGTGNFVGGQQPIAGNMPISQSFAPNINTGAASFARTSFGLAEPQIDISETKNDIVLACDLPNVNLNDLNLTVSENSCAISAQSWLNGQNVALHRTVPLPTLVRAESVDTNYSNGILQIRLPKKDVSSRRQINVNMSQ